MGIVKDITADLSHVTDGIGLPEDSDAAFYVALADLEICELNWLLPPREQKRIRRGLNRLATQFYDDIERAPNKERKEQLRRFVDDLHGLLTPERRAFLKIATKLKW
jgi:hypothetical protein